MHNARWMIGLVALFAVGCGESAGSNSSDFTEDDGDGGAGAGGAGSGGAASTSTDPDAVVARALAELAAQMEGRYAPYYLDADSGRFQDGARVAGCWKNPAGKDLTDVQKAFYCSMPLELRLCNTLQLLGSKDLTVRYSGYQACKSNVASMLHDPSFLYSEDVDAAYQHLFLEQDPAWSDDAIVAANRPENSASFPALLAQIVASLDQEAIDLAAPELKTIKDQLVADGLDPA